MNHVRFISLALIFAAACSGADTTGEIAVPLTTSTPDGTIYRLRDGQFQLGTPGGLSIGLTTEDDPDAPVIHVDLDAGDYQLLLLDGWRMERSEAGGPFAPTAASLVSINPRLFAVADGVTTEVSFVFRVEGDDVTLGGGVDIGIDVYTPCDPVAQTGCAAGERCTREGLADFTSRTTCAPEGTVALGGACNSPDVGFDDCVSGTACFSGICAANCDVNAATCSCVQALFLDVADAGSCQPSCDPLAQDCPNTNQGCYFTSSFAVCAGAGAGVQGDACMYLNSCVEGSICTGGVGPGGGMGCAQICAVSGSGGPTCGGGLTCVDAEVASLPNVGLCR